MSQTLNRPRLPYRNFSEFLGFTMSDIQHHTQSLNLYKYSTTKSRLGRPNSTKHVSQRIASPESTENGNFPRRHWDFRHVRYRRRRRVMACRQPLVVPGSSITIAHSSVVGPAYSCTSSVSWPNVVSRGRRRTLRPPRDVLPSGAESPSSAGQQAFLFLLTKILIELIFIQPGHSE